VSVDLERPVSCLLVTGATGLVGSQVCRLAVDAGQRVRALVRSAGAAGPLEAAGAEVVVGDITDPDSVVRAAKGADAVIHTAAVLGGTWTPWTPEEFFQINHLGSVAVLDAAREAGLRSVVLSTYGMFVWHETITETSKPWPVGSQSSPYIQAKIATFYEGMARAAAGVQSVNFVVPGCIYGPSLLGERALSDPTSFNSALLRGLGGELRIYVRMRTPWCYSVDVAAVALAAALRGRNGQTYLAMGREAEVMSLADFCNLGASIAGIDHRVENEDPSSNPEKYRTIGRHAQRVVADRRFDSSATNAELGVEPLPLEQGLTATIEWMRNLGRLDRRSTAE
jgi:dihydroflavonol-4-reductase